MPQQIVQEIQTTYDGTGLKAAASDMKDFESSTGNIGGNLEGVGTKYDGLLHRMERPIGRQAFQMMATDALMGSEAIGKATAGSTALAEGFHALGAAAMFASPEVAGIAIIAMGLVAIYEKIKGSQADATAEMVKSVDSLQKEIDLLGKNVDVMEKKGQITKEQANQLRDLQKADEGSLKTKLDSVKNEKDYSDAMAKSTVVLRSYMDAQGKVYQVAEQVGKSQFNQVDNLNRVKALLPELSKETDKMTAADLKAMDAKIKHAQAMEKLNAPMMSYITATQRITDVENANLALEKQYQNATPKQQEAIQKRIDANTAMISIDQQGLQKQTAHQKAEENILKQRASSYDKYLGAIDSSVEVHGKAVVFNSRKFLGEELKDVTNQAAIWLEIQAAKYFGAGNFAMGAAALAGAAAVKTLGSIGAGLLEAGGNTDVGTASSVASPSSSSSPSINSSSASQNQMNLQIILEGHQDVKSMMDMLIKNVNARVLSGGVNLIATQVTDQSGRFQPV